MSNTYKIVGLILVVQSIFIFNSCTKNTTVVEDTSPAITTSVSFSKDVLPLLTKNCAISGCHNGSIAPDLSATAAFASLTSGNFVNVSTPANSEVYLWLTGKRAVSMPAGGANNPSNINAYVLAWIKQGAKNN